jgi:hypothetical protein
LFTGTSSVLVACALWVDEHSTGQQQLSISVLPGGGSGFFAVWPNLIMGVVPSNRQGVSGGMVQVFGT